jgi:Fe-S-cluster-containing dehydrogenase component
MPKDVTRRAFIKGSLAAACTVAASAAAPTAARARSGDQQLATLLDIGKCIGCEACVEACRKVNAHKFPDPQKPFPKMFPSRAKVFDWSDKQDVADRLTPYNWLTIQRAEVEIDGEATEINIPRRCMHCVNPPCVKLCPFGAAKQYRNGISRLDADICLGGSKCNKVCPWHIPQRQTGVGIYLDLLPNFAGNGVMYKCDRCYERVAEGELPACIEACPEDVQTIGPRNEILDRTRALAKETGGFIYGAEENGGTNTFYVSPVPFEELHRAVEKGPGRPHLKPVADQMAEANNLAAAMIIAPFAGMAAAAAKIYKAGKK